MNRLPCRTCCVLDGACILCGAVYDCRWCYAEFHRCDGGGPGMFYSFTDNKA